MQQPQQQQPKNETQPALKEQRKDILTPLGCYSILLSAIIILSFCMQLTGAGGTDEDQPVPDSFFRIHEAFYIPQNKMLVQAIVMIIIIAIFELINVIGLKSKNLEYALAVFLLIVLLWVMLGYFLIFQAQGKMKHWYELESRINDPSDFRSLVEVYNKIYKQYEAIGELKVNKLKKIREDIEYQIMRLIFINPVSLPIMTEGYLRKDFNFALYLGFCYGKTLTQFFKWSMVYLLISLFLVIVLCITVEALSDDI